MPYGDRQPRLIGQQCANDKCKVSDFVGANSLCDVHKQYGVLVTTSHAAGYSNENHNFWNIQLATEANLKEMANYE